MVNLRNLEFLVIQILDSWLSKFKNFDNFRFFFKFL